MKLQIFFILLVTFANPFGAAAQVQVSMEPRHKKVLENKYIRLLDVWLQPGDTTQFHIHSTPSVFLHFSNTIIASQVKEQDWVTEQAVPGKSWYRSFSPDSVIHRVCNIGTVPFHVIDIEILSSYDTSAAKKPLPFLLLDDNEKTYTYKFGKNSFTTAVVGNRGPMIAELVAGDKVYYINALTKRETSLKTGGYLYIEPGASFYFSFRGKENLDMILIEIK